MIALVGGIASITVALIAIQIELRRIARVLEKAYDLDEEER